ncbi:purine nucleoside phosphorylase [Halyomorpha halys]|uniref:purine nucleoside phosphorylase n=1 Tax=Halyomorpha halys TaxID=286706 RepID=UPI0006D4E826|nr:purine nucleoside phosphorylase-like [Halyomorpha halys]
MDDLSKPRFFSDSNTYEAVEEIASWIKGRTAYRPKIGIICGTGLDTFPNEISDRVELEYSDIPHFPMPSVLGHPGRLVFGRLDGVEILCFVGKIFFFEGYDSFQCTVAVRVMKLLGISYLILSNAAGSVDEDMRPGDIMVMKDHINLVGLAGNGPLIGPSPQVDRWGERYLCLSQVYDRTLRRLAEEAALEVGLQDLKEGVYMMVGGPNFETVAEARMIRVLGANVVGMSTVSDAIVAVQAGMKVFSFSIISNLCLLNYNTTLNIDHAENIAIGQQKTPLIAKWIRKFVANIFNQPA